MIANHIRAILVETDDGNIWCPPAFISKIKGESYEDAAHVVKRPYWTTGPKCGHQKCGPELSDGEIAQYLKGLL